MRARMVAPTEVPSDVVTMNSRVRYVDELTRREREVVLAYPDSGATEGHVSVLSPVGVALLGLRVGEAIDWLMPDGRTHRLRVLAVLFQPEAAGRYDL